MKQNTFKYKVFLSLKMLCVLTNNKKKSADNIWRISLEKAKQRIKKGNNLAEKVIKNNDE